MSNIINLDEISTNGFIDKEGAYTLTVKSFEKQTTANKGTEVHKFVCESEDGERITLSLYITEKSMWKYKLFLKALGHSGEGNVDLDTIGNACIGKKFIGTVKKEAPRVNIVTGETEEGKYFEIVKFTKC
jgi:hypothetical protein